SPADVVGATGIDCSPTQEQTRGHGRAVAWRRDRDLKGGHGEVSRDHGALVPGLIARFHFERVCAAGEPAQRCRRGRGEGAERPAVDPPGENEIANRCEVVARSERERGGWG